MQPLTERRQNRTTSTTSLTVKGCILSASPVSSAKSVTPPSLLLRGGGQGVHVDVSPAWIVYCRRRINAVGIDPARLLSPDISSSVVDPGISSSCVSMGCSLSLSLSPGLGDGSTSPGFKAHPLHWVALSLSVSLSFLLSPRLRASPRRGRPSAGWMHGVKCNKLLDAPRGYLTTFEGPNLSLNLSLGLSSGPLNLRARALRFRASSASA